MEQKGEGWLVFSAIVLGVAGVMRVFDAIWAFRYHGALPQNLENAIFGTSLKTYGWVYLIVAAILIVCAIGVMARSQFSRWIGIVAGAVLSISAIWWMPYYPVWSLTYIFAGIAGHLRPGRLRGPRGNRLGALRRDVPRRPPGRSRGPSRGRSALGLSFFDCFFEFEGESKGLRDCTGCRYRPGCSDDRRNGNQDALCILQGETRFASCRQVQKIGGRRGIDRRQCSQPDQHEFTGPQLGVAHRSRGHFHDRVEEWSFFAHLLVPFSLGGIAASTTTVPANDEDDSQVATACLALDCSRTQPLVQPFTVT